MAHEGRTCLDSPARKKDLRKAVGLYPCHNQGGNQVKTTTFLIQEIIYTSPHLRQSRFYFIFTVSLSFNFCVDFFLLLFIFRFLFSQLYYRSRMYGQINVLIQLLSLGTCICRLGHGRVMAKEEIRY